MGVSGNKRQHQASALAVFSQGGKPQPKVYALTEILLPPPPLLPLQLPESPLLTQHKYLWTAGIPLPKVFVSQPAETALLADVRSCSRLSC